MAPSIGLNLRVTGYKHQGGRKYMEDEFGVAYQQTADEKDLEYAFFGIFDGHGGREAALFAKVSLGKFLSGCVSAKKMFALSLCSGSRDVCYGSRSADPYLWITDSDCYYWYQYCGTYWPFNIDQCC
jgi:hypothetical protein